MKHQNTNCQEVKGKALGGIVDDTVIPLMSMEERGWWKCTKCGAVYESWSNPPTHHCKLK